jgi:serine carboxypeptidase-like clade I
MDEASERSLFYYLVQSERDPASDPVVLWLNGGPGCSSFDGFVYENGPFSFQPGSTPGGLPKLHPNPYTWSKVTSSFTFFFSFLVWSIIGNKLSFRLLSD